MAIAPAAERDEELTRQVVGDVTEPGRGVLPEGDAYVEARFGDLLRARLLDRGWEAGEPWTPLQRNLANPVEDCGVRIEVIGPERAHVRAEVQRAAFENSTFTDERWYAMAAGLPGLPYADARCLVAYDDRGNAVAAVTVWSAGPGRPGLLEPMGVHREHRGHGYGKAVTVAAAAALREMGASNATVCTAQSNRAGVATYKSAGFRALRDVQDLRRSA